MMDPQLARPITSAASADDLATMSLAKPEDKKGNLMRNQGSSIDLATLYSQQHQPGYGWQQQHAMTTTQQPIQTLPQHQSMVQQQPMQLQATQDYLANSLYSEVPAGLQFQPAQFSHQAELIIRHLLKIIETLSTQPRFHHPFIQIYCQCSPFRGPGFHPEEYFEEY